MKKRIFTKAVSLILAVLLVFSGWSVPMQQVAAAAYTGIMHQIDPIYQNYWYGNMTLYDGGCGIFALANAVGYLTGYKLDVIEVADWAYSVGVFDDVYGIWGDYFYELAGDRYGPTYGFAIDADDDGRGYYGSIYDTRIKNHLMAGGTVVVHVEDHFMTLVGYDSGSGKYHVYDSGPCAPRNTLPNGDVWLTAGQLNSGYTSVDWYWLVSSKVNDTEKPVISNVQVYNVTPAGYTVSCTVTDNVEIQKVAFPTWTLLNGQDDLAAEYMDTQLGTRNGNTYTFHVKTSAHNSEPGYYVTHIYAVDTSGNTSNASTGNIYVPEDKQKPVITDVEYTEVSAQGYTVSCTVTDDWGVVSVAFPTWTVENGQDDLKADWWNTQAGEKNGNRYTFRVNASEHNGEGGYYATHIYAKDIMGKVTTVNLNAVRVMDDEEKPVITNVRLTDITPEGYTVTCKVTDNWGVHSVSFPTWTVENGQDDLPADFLNTQRGTKDGDTYTFLVKVSDHNGEQGNYVTHIYAKDCAGNVTVYTLDSFDILNPETWVERACFDAEIYRARYKDLAGLTDQQLKEHWLTNGIREGRTASVILDLAYYLNNNSDLRQQYGDDYAAIYEHFITTGYKEYRKSSPVFDGSYYTKTYENVAKEYGENYLRHYVEKGMAQGYRGSLSFDVDYYRFLKLQVMYYDDAACVKDYITTGYPEGIRARDTEKPVISEARITDITASGYTVICKVTDNWGVDRVAFPTWTLANDQDDLDNNFMTTQLGTKRGDIYTFRVSTSEHNNEGGKYATHIYAIDKAGNRVSVNLAPVEVKDPLLKLTPTASSGYKVKYGLITNVKAATTVDALLGRFENDGLEAWDPEGRKLEGTDEVSTGCTLHLYLGGVLIDTLTVVVPGDINGDGTVDTTDYLRVKAAFLGDLTLSDAESCAADVDASKTIDATDYLRIKAHILGTFDLYN